MGKLEVVWFTMVEMPDGGLMRVGNAYARRDVAESWIEFVEASHGRPAEVEGMRIEWTPDGKLSAATLGKLDARYNLDPPGGMVADG